MNNATRNDVKKLAQQIEELAKQVQSKLNSGDDVLLLANELVRNNATFVFTLGEVFALEQLGSNKKVKATKAQSGTRNFHCMRDKLGRFTRKV